MGLDPTVRESAPALLPAPNAGDVIPGAHGKSEFRQPRLVERLYVDGENRSQELTEKHQLALRYAYNHSVDSNPFHSELAPGLDAISSPAYTHGVFAGLTSTPLKSTLVNDFKFG